MKTQHKQAIDKVIEESIEQLKQLQIEIRTDLLDVIDALSLVTGKSQVEYLEDLNEGIVFRIRLLKGIRKRKVGRPRKEKVKTNGSK
jgi:hypothetical protein